MLHIARSGLNWRNTVQVVLIGLSLHYLGTPGKLNVMLDVRRILGLHEHLLSAPWYRARFACRSFLSVDKLSGPLCVTGRGEPRICRDRWYRL